MKSCSQQSWGSVPHLCSDLWSSIPCALWQGNELSQTPALCWSMEGSEFRSALLGASLDALNAGEMHLLLTCMGDVLHFTMFPFLLTSARCSTLEIQCALQLNWKLSCSGQVELCDSSSSHLLFAELISVKREKSSPAPDKSYKNVYHSFFISVQCSSLAKDVACLSVCLLKFYFILFCFFKLLLQRFIALVNIIEQML